MITKTTKQDLRDIMKNAWGILKMGAAQSFSKALKLAWKKFKLQIQLMTGQVSFTFIKADMSVREAVGTTDGRLFGYVAPVRRFLNAACVAYFDLDKDAWRMLRIDRLTTINS